MIFSSEISSNNCILITGATGYLGSEIVKALVESGTKVVVLKRKSSDLKRLIPVKEKIVLFNIEEGVKRVFDTHKVNGVIHCATDYGRHGSSSDQIAEANIIFPLKLLSCGLKSGIEFFINTGTLLQKDTNDYSLSKHQFLEWIQKYSSKAVCVNLALEHFYGHDFDQSKFLTWIISQTLTGQKIPLTKGEQKRDFLYISDVVTAYLTVLRNIKNLDKGYHHFEVGSGSAITIKDLVGKISALCAPHSAEFKFGEVAYRPNEQMETHVDISALRHLGWSPQVSLDEGLKKTIHSLKSCQE